MFLLNKAAVRLADCMSYPPLESSNFLHILSESSLVRGDLITENKKQITKINALSVHVSHFYSFDILSLV